MFGSFKRFFQAFALIWSWQLPRSHESRLLGPQTSQSRSLRREKKRVRQQLQTRQRRRPPRRLMQHARYRDTRSKDARYSNQQKLRRMYRNC